MTRLYWWTVVVSVFTSTIPRTMGIKCLRCGQYDNTSVPCDSSSLSTPIVDCPGYQSRCFETLRRINISGADSATVLFEMIRGCKIVEQEGPMVQLTDADLGVRADLGNLSVNLINKSDHVVSYCNKDLCNNGELDEMVADYKKGELSQPIWRCRNLDVCFVSPPDRYDIDSVSGASQMYYEINFIFLSIVIVCIS